MSSVTLDELQKENALKGYLTEKPWADTYWPLNQKGVSHRWIGSHQFETFEAQRDDAIKALSGETYESTWQLSPAEKYDVLVGDSAYGMTKEGWDVYAQYARRVRGIGEKTLRNYQRCLRQFLHAMDGGNRRGSVPR